ncbi:MAG TPA: hypothetical protein VMG38_05450 [Trebonia sp.]|nr:hypothetical protein [Trebonia sp.]
MNNPPDISQALDDNDGPLDPRQAAALLEQATQHARRTFRPPSPQLWAFRAVFVLVAFGGFWLSVRGRQNPYSGPSGWSLLVTFALVAVNIAWTTAELRRAGAGVSGPAQRKRNAFIGVMLVVWVVAYAATAPLYHAGPSQPAWALYPASAPLMVIGLAGAAIAAALHYWRLTVITAALGLVAVVAGFGGPVGVWLIMGIGLCAVSLGAAAFAAWQRHQKVIAP